MKGEHTGAKTCRETLATFHLFPLTRQWSFLSFSPQPPFLLFFKVGPIGRSTEFSKDETTGVMEREGEKGKERREEGSSVLHGTLIYLGEGGRREPRGALPSPRHRMLWTVQKHLLIVCLVAQEEVTNWESDTHQSRMQPES